MESGSGIILGSRPGSDTLIVLLLDGNSDIGTHVWSDIGKFCLMHLLTAVENLKLCPNSLK